ncbi:MAG: hypothetical protein Kow0059_00580 [Candidatus Sumerlaeia bacterium]
MLHADENTHFPVSLMMLAVLVFALAASPRWIAGQPAQPSPSAPASPGSTAPAPPIEGRLAAEPPEVEVAAPLTVRIEVDYEPAVVRIIRVEWDDGGFERTGPLPAPRTSDLPDGRKRYVQAIPARTWEVDRAEFGPVTVHFEYKGEARKLQIEPLSVTIKSLLEDAGDARIGDFQTPMAVPPRPWWHYAVPAAAALALLLAAGVWLWLRRRRRAVLEAPRPALPPDLEALQAIDELMDSDLIERGEVKEFFTRLGDIVRRYLERRFALPALESTSFEILLAAGGQGMADEPLRLLERLFDVADRTKFAKYRPTHAEMAAAADQAREFIVLTRPRISDGAENAPPAPQFSGAA